MAIRKSKPWMPDRGLLQCPRCGRFPKKACCAVPLVWGPQRRFLQELSDVGEVLNAGAVGGGKTDMGVMGAVIYPEYAKSNAYAGLILRHDEKDFEKHLLSLVSRPGYYDRYAGGSLNRTKLVWTTAAGGSVIFAHAKRLLGIQGPEFQYAWFDELTHWKGSGWLDADPPREYAFVITRMRSATGIPVRLRAGTNPGGPGKAWVGRRWAPWLQGASYLTLPEGAPPHHRDSVESYRRLIEAGHVPGPVDGQPLVPSGTILWCHITEEGVETWEPPPRDREEAHHREILSRSCLRTQTNDNPGLRQGDPQYGLRTRIAGPVLYRQFAKDDWEAEEPGGGFFEREWFKGISRDAVPWGEIVGVMRRWDFAWSRHQRGSKTSERSPWSVGVKVAWTAKHPQFGRRWYIIDIVRAQGDPNTIMRLVHETAKSDKIDVPILAPVDFSAGKVVLSDLRNLLEGYRVMEQREHGDKHVRIATLQDPAEAGKIKLVADEWNHAFREEAARYPKKPDDQLDALAGVYLHVIEGEGGIPRAEDVDAALEQMSPLAAAFGNAATGPARESMWDRYRGGDEEEDDGDGWSGGYGVPG